MTEVAPDWDRLPDDPEGFFGLEEGYDRKQLKRAYGRLLKRFKPEKYPQEFQRLRRAYEELETALRYGMQEPRQQQHTQPPPTTPDTPRHAMHLNDFLTHLASFHTEQALNGKNEPNQAYQALRVKQDKEANDYYLLAVLSDVVPSDNNFVTWLAAGLQAFPYDWGLYSLLFEYCRGTVPRKDAPDLLMRLGKTLPGNQFYPITEHLWLNLLDQLPFDAFTTLLEQVERHVRGSSDTARAIFQIRLMKRAFWKADLPWLSACRNELEEHFSDLNDEQEHDLELLEALLAYRKDRETQSWEHPFHQRIHQVITTFCEAEEWQADRLYLECQMAMAEDPEGIRKAFPIDHNMHAVWRVWTVITWKIENRLNTTDEPEISPMGNLKVIRFLEQLEAKTAAHQLGRLRSVIPILYYTVLFLIMLLIPVGLLVFAVGGGLSPRIAVFLFFTWAPFSLFGLKDRVIDPRLSRWEAGLRRTCYHDIWQPMLFQFLATEHLDSRILNHHLHTIARSDFFYKEEVAAYVEYDFALHFYALSQRFVS